MAFCKVCDCGNKIVFQRRLAFPMECPNCGRDTRNFETYSEDDPAVEERLRMLGASQGAGQAGEAGQETPGEEPGAGVGPGELDLGGATVNYCLSLPGGVRIAIPEGGCIVGRTANGGEELAEYGSVSRQHVRLTPRRGSGVLVEDLSTYGTWVDGRKLEKNVPVRVRAGAVIVLCNLETRLEITN